MEYSIRQLCQDLKMDDEATAVVLSAWSETEFSSLEPFLSGMMDIVNPMDSFLAIAKRLGGDERGMKILAVQLECARRCRERYRQKGIDEKIYTDTMACFSRFVREYRQKHGQLGFDCPWWAYRQLNMTIFRLGALEFEFEPNSDRINIHIPSDADFSDPSVEDALAQCHTFTKRYFPEYSNAQIGCHSWLLSPVLTPLLKEGSHILAFQKRFTITKVFKEENQYIGFLFQTDEGTPIDELKEETSLQRRVKSLMKKGIGLGAAYGVLR